MSLLASGANLLSVPKSSPSLAPHPGSSSLAGDLVLPLTLLQKSQDVENRKILEVRVLPSTLGHCPLETSGALTSTG